MKRLMTAKVKTKGKAKAKVKRPAWVWADCHGCRLLEIVGLKRDPKQHNAVPGCESCATRRGDPPADEAEQREKTRKLAAAAAADQKTAKDLAAGVPVWRPAYLEHIKQWKAAWGTGRPLPELALPAADKPPAPETPALPAKAAKPPKTDPWGAKAGSSEHLINKTVAASGKWISVTLIAKRAGVKPAAAKGHLAALRKLRAVTARVKDGVAQVRANKPYN